MIKVSCHCGNIELEVTAELADVVECNCSMCVQSGILTGMSRPTR